MKAIAGILMMITLVICAVPLIGPESKIELATYLGIPLVILMGSAGIAFISKRFEAIIGGIIISALWPVLLEAVKAV
ncbi:hypothetical protein ES708_19262 [subsurface metagenome]